MTDAISDLDFSYGDQPRAVLSDGAELYTERHGQGSPLVVLNNFFMASPVWRGFTGRISTTHEVLSYDLRGQGASGQGSEPSDWATNVRDLGELLDHHGIERAHLLGTSISALICRDFALAHPERVESLIFAGPAFSPWGRRRHRMVLRSWVETLRERGMRALFDQMYPFVFGDRMMQEIGTPGYLALRESFLMLHSQDQIDESLSISLQADPDPGLLSGLSVPVLLLVGDDDFGWNGSAVERLRSLVDDLSVAVLPGAGHLPFLEATDLFETAVLDFTRTLQERS